MTIASIQLVLGSTLPAQHPPKKHLFPASLHRSLKCKHYRECTPGPADLTQSPHRSREAVGTFSKVSFVGPSGSDLCPEPSSTVCLNLFQSVRSHKSSLGRQLNRQPVLHKHEEMSLRQQTASLASPAAFSARLKLLKINIETRTKPHVCKTKLEGSKTRPGDAVTSCPAQLVPWDSVTGLDPAARASTPSQSREVLVLSV